MLVVAGFLSGARLSAAQLPETPPSPGGLFGDTKARPPGRHNVDLSISVVEANDSEAPPELAGIAPPEAVLGGFSTMVIGEAEYRWQGPRVQVGATGASVLRHYTALEGSGTRSHSGGVGVSARLDGRTTLLANQTAAYSPSHLLSLFPGMNVINPGDATPLAPDYAVSNTESYSYRTNLQLTRGLSRRSHASVTGEFHYIDYLSRTSARRDLDSRGLRGDYSRNLARNLVVRLGYRYRTGTFDDGAAPSAPGADVTASTEHGVAVGLEYSRPLSATRQMAFAVEIGSSDVSRAGAAAVSRVDRVTRLSGDASAVWQFTRTWQTRVAFRRGVEYVTQLSEPVFITGISADLAGLLTPRLDVEVGTRYSTGASALTPAALAFDTYGSDVRLRYGLTRTLAIYGQYVYYFYDFQQNALLPSGIPPGLERNGIRAGFTLWIPAVRR